MSWITIEKHANKVIVKTRDNKILGALQIDNPGHVNTGIFCAGHTHGWLMERVKGEAIRFSSASVGCRQTLYLC